MKSYPLFRYVRPVLALIIMLASFGFLFLLVMRPIPGENKETINLVSGFVLGMVGTVAAYYFGTSKDKSDLEQTQREETKKP